VRRRYTADIYLVGTTAAQTLEFLFLEDTEQLGLQG